MDRDVDMEYLAHYIAMFFVIYLLLKYVVCRFIVTYISRVKSRLRSVDHFSASRHARGTVQFCYDAIN